MLQCISNPIAINIDQAKQTKTQGIANMKSICYHSAEKIFKKEKKMK